LHRRHEKISGETKTVIWHDRRSPGRRVLGIQRKITTLKPIVFWEKSDFRANTMNAERSKCRQRTNGFGAAADLFPENSRDLSNERPQVTLKGLQVAASAGNPGDFVC
jgi:hypothetical protein